MLHKSELPTKHKVPRNRHATRQLAGPAAQVQHDHHTQHPPPERHLLRQPIKQVLVEHQNRHFHSPQRRPEQTNDSELALQIKRRVRRQTRPGLLFAG